MNWLQTHIPSSSSAVPCFSQSPYSSHTGLLTASGKYPRFHSSWPLLPLSGTSLPFWFHQYHLYVVTPWYSESYRNNCSFTYTSQNLIPNLGTAPITLFSMQLLVYLPLSTCLMSLGDASSSRAGAGDHEICLYQFSCYWDLVYECSSINYFFYLPIIKLKYPCGKKRKKSP